MTFTNHPKLALPVILLLSLVISCTSNQPALNFADTWTVIDNQENDFQLTDTASNNETIKVTPDSIIHTGIMDELRFKADHIHSSNQGVTYYPGKEERYFYKFTWVDPKRGIAKCEIDQDGTSLVRYVVNKANLKSIKKTTNKPDSDKPDDTIGDRVNDSLVLGNGDKTLYVEDDDCISVRNKDGNQLYERCFDNMILRIRPVKGDLLPLTFINGSRSIDIDFYSNGNEWVSKTATYYGPAEGGEQNITRPFVVSIKQFDFDEVVSRFSE